MIFTKQERNIIIFVLSVLLLGFIWLLLRKFVFQCGPKEDLLRRTEQALDDEAADDAGDSGYEPAASEAGSPVNVNSASVEELAALPFLGLTKAKAIVSYRDKNGTFQSLHELVKVSGIGEKLLEKIEPFIEL